MARGRGKGRSKSRSTKSRGRSKRGGKKWIQGAIKNPGAFSAKAKRAGMSTSAYARHVTRKGSKASAKTKRQANLAKTLGKMRARRGR